MGKAEDRPVGMTVLEATSTPEALEGIARRREYIAPLFAYLSEHFYSRGRVLEMARQRAVSAGEYAPWDARSWYDRTNKIKRGEARIPPWLVTLCCSVIETSVAEVMGGEWVARYGADGCGGSDVSPACEPRRQRGWVRDARNAADSVLGDSAEDHDDAA